MVNLIGLDAAQNLDETTQVGHIAKVHGQARPEWLA